MVVDVCTAERCTRKHEAGIGKLGGMGLIAIGNYCMCEEIRAEVGPTGSSVMKKNNGVFQWLFLKTNYKGFWKIQSKRHCYNGTLEVFGGFKVDVYKLKVSKMGYLPTNQHFHYIAIPSSLLWSLNSRDFQGHDQDLHVK